MAAERVVAGSETRQMHLMLVKGESTSEGYFEVVCVCCGYWYDEYVEHWASLILMYFDLARCKNYLARCKITKSRKPTTYDDNIVTSR